MPSVDGLGRGPSHGRCEGCQLQRRGQGRSPLCWILAETAHYPLKAMAEHRHVDAGSAGQRVPEQAAVWPRGGSGSCVGCPWRWLRLGWCRHGPSAEQCGGERTSFPSSCMKSHLFIGKVIKLLLCCFLFGVFFFLKNYF